MIQVAPLINSPALWKASWPRQLDDQHKYDRGHAMVSGGEMECTGAAKLAALSALRTGAGLVSILCSYEALPVYAESLLSVMTKPYKNIDEFEKLISDKHVKALALGPGNGVNDATKERVLAVLKLQKPTVLDADALTVFASSPEELFAAIKGDVVLTPHEGEFTKIFGKVTPETRIQCALKAAQISGAIVVLKGHETLIASPEGNLVIQKDAPVTLATAGSGDVLTGVICGLLSQGMPVFDAACAGVWMHAEAAKLKGVGLISEDLPDLIPQVLKSLM